jgi:hypothetical protein
MCNELEQLRTRVADLRRDLRDRRQLAKQRATNVRPDRTTSDFDVYLERKIQKAVSAIQEHIAQHGCQS